MSYFKIGDDYWIHNPDGDPKGPYTEEEVKTKTLANLLGDKYYDPAKTVFDIPKEVVIQNDIISKNGATIKLR